VSQAREELPLGEQRIALLSLLHQHHICLREKHSDEEECHTYRLLEYMNVMDRYVCTWATASMRVVSGVVDVVGRAAGTAPALMLPRQNATHSCADKIDRSAHNARNEEARWGE
jgi:hypothetical protein